MRTIQKKVLIHTLIFSPDGVSTAYLYNDIALSLKSKGFEVVVLTTTPHFNVVKEQLTGQPMKWGIWGIYKKSLFNGIPVFHVPQKKFKRTFLRLIGFLYWHFISFFIGLTIKNLDIILSPSPPLTIGCINHWLGKVKGCKVVYNVQEIYPDILGKKGSLAHKVLSRIEYNVYNRSDAVTTIDKVFYDTIVDRFEDKSKLHIIPNFVDTVLYNPSVKKDLLDSKMFPQSNKIKMLYAGNIGLAQSWEPFIALAKKTKDLDVEYFVIGEGNKKNYIKKQKVAHGLENIHILPYQPRQIMPSILAYSDIQFIFMSPEMDMQGFPSKVYTIMACAKPLLVCSRTNTPIVNFLKEKNCAKIVTENDFEKKVDEMVNWLQTVTKDELKRMGNNGMDIIKTYYTKEIVTDQYVNLIASLLI